jgi:hypothetical protein
MPHRYAIIGLPDCPCMLLGVAVDYRQSSRKWSGLMNALAAALIGLVHEAGQFAELREIISQPRQRPERMPYAAMSVAANHARERPNSKVIRMCACFVVVEIIARHCKAKIM